MRAVLHYSASAGFRRRLEAAAPSWLEIGYAGPDDHAGFAAAMQGAEVLLHVLAPLTGSMIAAVPSLRLVQKIGVGVNTIDLAAAAARGIAVANMPGTNSRAVAEMTLALMLATLRRLVPLDRATRAGHGWSMPPSTYDQVGELGGRRVGLVGFGAVPRLLAPVLAALGAEVLYHSPAPKPDAPGRWMPLAELLAASDLVSLHLPLTDATRHLIDRAAIATMKPGSVLINTARGALVDEAALVEALASGRLGAAGLDVLAVEPAGPGHPLFALDNLVVAPHVAWLTPETLDRSIGIAMENCRRLRAGERLLNQVVPA